MPSNTARDGLVIASDVDVSTFAREKIPNGTVFMNYVNYFYVDGTTELFDVQFIDHGDSGITVPESGSGLATISFAATLLLGVRHRSFSF